MNKKQRLILLTIFALGGVFLIAAGYLIWQSGDAETGRDSLENYDGVAPPAGLRITITDSGLARISADDLRRVHFADIDLALSRNGEPVPFFQQDGDIYFYALASANTLDAPIVYWLEPGAGQMMDNRPAAAAGAGSNVGLIHYRWETNEIFVAFAESDDAWFGQRLFAPGPLSEAVIPIAGVTSDGGGGQLRLRVWSNNADEVDPDHHLQAQINDMLVLDHTWDGKLLEVASGEIPAGALRAADNQLQLSAPGDTGVAGEDALDFSSAEAVVAVTGAAADDLLLDITDPHQPVRLTGLTADGDGIRFGAAAEMRRYLLATPDQALRPALSVAMPWDSLKDAGRGADYIAIVPDASFADAVQPLLDYRAETGLAVITVPVANIYDEFGGGQPSASAIRDFLSYTAANWQPAPRFVLLVGDASYDTHNFSAGANANLIPTYHVYTEYAGYVASDTWLTMTADNDLRPQQAIGRLPAQTPAEVTVMVNKILAYETAASADWQSQALLVADDEEQFDRVIIDLALDLDGSGFNTNQLLMSENEDIHGDIMSSINSGVGLINYVGHGSVQVWGDERVFQAADAADLVNEDRYPIFITFTCLNGYFNHPEVDALAEALLRQANGGIVAAIAPSGRSLTNQQTEIADVFYPLLLGDDSPTLGEALLSAKQAGAEKDYLFDVIHTFNLLGDPALRFHHPSG